MDRERGRGERTRKEDTVEPQWQEKERKRSDAERTMEEAGYGEKEGDEG